MQSVSCSRSPYIKANNNHLYGERPAFSYWALILYRFLPVPSLSSPWALQSPMFLYWYRKLSDTHQTELPSTHEANFRKIRKSVQWFKSTWNNHLYYLVAALTFKTVGLTVLISVQINVQPIVIESLLQFSSYHSHHCIASFKGHSRYWDRGSFLVAAEYFSYREKRAQKLGTDFPVITDHCTFPASASPHSETTSNLDG